MNMYFLKLLLKFCVNIKKADLAFMADLLANALHEKVMICYIIMLIMLYY